MGYLQEIGRRVKERYRELGMTGKQLAQDIGVSQNTMSSIVKGENVPGIDKMLLIAQALNVSLDWLVFGHGTPDGAERGGGAYPGARRPAAGFPGAACSIIQALPAQEQEKVYNILLILYGDTKAD